jgi:hypothetical protein
MVPPAQRLDQFHERPDRLDGEHRIGTGVRLRHAVGIRPGSRHPHHDAVDRADNKLARAIAHDRERLALEGMMLPRDPYVRRRRREEVIVPSV